MNWPQSQWSVPRHLGRSYTCRMEVWHNPNEDARGVDVGQIRELLRMSVAERAREMVRVANLMAKARQSAQLGRSARS